MLTLEVTDCSSLEFDSGPMDLDLLGSLIGGFIDSTGIYEGDATAALSFVSNDAMMELNRRYRGLDEPTDVLSFPLWEEEGAFVPQAGWDALPLGDIVVSSEYVRENAERNGSNIDKEFILVIVHGALHLVGFDHDTGEREAAMWSAQDGIVSQYFESLRRIAAFDPKGGLMTE